MPNGFEPGKGMGVGLPRRGIGGAEQCRCPICGFIQPHPRGMPCNQIKCPKCGNVMVGG